MSASSPFRPGRSFARRLDARDPLKSFRSRFHIPKRPDGRPALYFCGNSLGLQPKAAGRLVEAELDAWARLGVRGHFEGRSPWFPYHEAFRGPGARLVGAKPGEVVMMNGLTVNLHLMLASFYRPKGRRRKILIQEPSFPSDRYAAASRLRLDGFDPRDALVRVGPRPGADSVGEDELEAALERAGAETSLVLLEGVNYFTGRALDIARLTRAAHRRGALIGWDLAHAAGNLKLRLHDWGVDFAVWCSYKYLNSGPGAAAGCFVHERHGNNPAVPRLAGWWGNDPKKRFRMHLEPEFAARPGADGWQLSNPPILAMAPLRASLAVFEEAGMAALRAKSVKLTGYLEWLLERIPGARFKSITPRAQGERGAQLSLRLGRGAKKLAAELEAQGVVADFRPPDVLRVAPVPLYTRFMDVWEFADILERALR